VRRLKGTVLAVLVAVFSWMGYDTAAADIDHPIDPGGLRTATRLNPQPKLPTLWTTASANGRCVGLVDALEYWSPGWPVDRMAAIAYRESRCEPDAANSCCTGVLQIHASWLDNVAMCGIDSRTDLKDPWLNICAAAVVYREQGITAWSTA